MGGSGSGRHWHYGTKSTTNDLRSIDVRRWAREGLLRPGTDFQWRWQREGENVASIRACGEPSAVRLIYRAQSHGEDWRSMDYRVRLDWTPCHYGGDRAWFLCPAQGCGRRVALLYGGTVFACRKCHDLAYPSQHEDRCARAQRKVLAIEKRLGGVEGFGDKPKGMHWRTYERLVAEHDAAGASVNAAFIERFGRILGTTDLF